MQLTIQATRPQADFLTLAKRYRLFCAGYGAGKSEALVAAAMIDACQSTEALIACYAPTYDLVRLITAARLQAKLDEHGIAHKYNRQDNAIYTASAGWGDFILRTLDNPERIVGYESYTAHVDELDTLKTEHAREAWNRIIARNRQQPAGITEPFNQASAYTTPEGFRFAHWRWVQKATAEHGIIQAPSYSNPYLPDGYIQSLRESYPEALADAYIEGRFVNLTSGTVYSAFDRGRCSSNERITAQERLYVGLDFNVGAMAGVVYVRRGEQMHAVEEIVDGYDTPAVIELLKARYPRHALCIYPDASGTSRKTVNASQSDIALLQQAGFEVRAPKRNPAVKDRILAANRAFEQGLVKINARGCPEFVRCLEQQAYDRNGEPDKQSGHDHLNDAGTYPIAYEMPVRKPVSDVSIRFAI